MVQVKNLSVKINQKQILDNINFTLMPNKITVFVGKSGAGKSTLLKALIDLTPISNGEILINNQKLNNLTSIQKSENIGYVFQDFNLFSNLTVLQNCTDALIVHGKNEQESKETALKELEKLGMENFANKYPNELSGGQKQRVAIARALCLKPKVLLLDEPTASLDPDNTDKLIKVLEKLKKEDLTIGLASQDMNFVKKIFDRIYYIETGEIIELCEDATLENCPAVKKFIKN